MVSILVLNGPNLNLLGTREPGHYGSMTLSDVEKSLMSLAEQKKCRLEFFQTNSESELIEKIHGSANLDTDFILINPAAFTHTSVALRDALLGVAIPFIELHISNVYAREDFRHHSYLSDVAVGVISGMGTYGYQLALLAALEKLNAAKTE